MPSARLQKIVPPYIRSPVADPIPLPVPEPPDPLEPSQDLVLWYEPDKDADPANNMTNHGEAGSSWNLVRSSVLFPQTTYGGDIIPETYLGRTILRMEKGPAFDQEADSLEVIDAPHITLHGTSYVVTRLTDQLTSGTVNMTGIHRSAPASWFTNWSTSELRHRWAHLQFAVNPFISPNTEWHLWVSYTSVQGHQRTLRLDGQEIGQVTGTTQADVGTTRFVSPSSARFTNSDLHWAEYRFYDHVGTYSPEIEQALMNKWGI